MSGCTRDQTLAFRAPGKIAYLFGDLSRRRPARVCKTSPASMPPPRDGRFPDARVLGGLRLKALARIPG